MTKKDDVIDTAVRAGDFHVFTTALAESGMRETLKETGPYTIFAPTDQAFARLPKDKLNDLAENRDSLSLLLRNHIVLGKLMVHDLVRLDKARTAKGEELRIDDRDGLWLNQARVLSADLEASNGVVHTIDSVLLPEDQYSSVSD